MGLFNFLIEVNSLCFLSFFPKSPSIDPTFIHKVMHLLYLDVVAQLVFFSPSFRLCATQGRLVIVPFILNIISTALSQEQLLRYRLVVFTLT